MLKFEAFEASPSDEAGGFGVASVPYTPAPFFNDRFPTMAMAETTAKLVQHYYDRGMRDGTRELQRKLKANRLDYTRLLGSPE